MECLKLQLPAVGSSVPPACRPRVYIDGRRRRDLHVRRWSVATGPEFGEAQLVPFGLGSLSIDALATRLPAVGSHVRLTVGAPHAQTVFAGYVAKLTTDLGEDGELPIAWVTHVLASDLREPVLSRRQRDGQGWAAMAAARVEFNGPAHSLASQEWFALGGRQSPVFDSQDTHGRAWTVGEAMGYLLASLPATVATPSMDELMTLAGGQVLAHTDITGESLAQALTRVARQGALELRPTREHDGLVAYRPGEQGRVRNVRLQPAGEALSIEASNVWRGRVSLSPQPGVPGVQAMGSLKQYEATFDLQPGWDSALESDSWRAFVRSADPAWPGVASVYRKWVLNEHGQYCGGPWHLPLYPMTRVDGTDFGRNIARRLDPCLTADSSGESLGVVVEVYDATGQWRLWQGPVRVSDSECAIYLDGDSLPGDYFQAAVAGEARVRVTATVTSDTPLSVTVPGTPGVPIERLDHSADAHWRQVHWSSQMARREGTSALGECDDTSTLTALAQSHHAQLHGGVQAQVTLGWVDAFSHVGDRVSQIAGRGIDLTASTEATSAVVGVSHDLDTQTTQLNIRG